MVKVYNQNKRNKHYLDKKGRLYQGKEVKEKTTKKEMQRYSGKKGSFSQGKR